MMPSPRQTAAQSDLGTAARAKLSIRNVSKTFRGTSSIAEV